MPLASDRQVNEKPFEIGMNLQKTAGFHPLSWEKTAKIEDRKRMAVIVKGRYYRGVSLRHRHYRILP